jgi:hypothetical protein
MASTVEDGSGYAGPLAKLNSSHSRLQWDIQQLATMDLPGKRCGFSSDALPSKSLGIPAASIHSKLIGTT